MPDRQNVLRNYGFFLSWKDNPRAGYFTKVTGLGLKVQTIEYREGGSPSTALKLPGRTSINDVELWRGVTQSDTLWAWLHSVSQGLAVPRHDVSIVVLNTDGQSEIMRWNLGNAYISECEVASFDALGNEVLVERLKLVSETLERAEGEQA